MTPPRLHRPRRSPSVAALLALLLLWTQALGLLHRVQHAPPPPGNAPAWVTAEARSDAGLFNHERKSDACQLFDQLALGDLAGVGIAPPATLPAEPAAIAATQAPQAEAARHAYRARAPPLTIA